MSSKILAAVIVIASSVASFRRAGEGFTATGKAFPPEHFNDKQMAAIQAEPKLSVKHVPVDAIPEGVDTTLVDAHLAEAAQAEVDAQDSSSGAKKAKTATKA